MKKLIFAIFSLMILSCNHGIEKPDNLVDRDTFKSILTQMYLYKQAPTVSVARDIDFNVINATILANHHVSAEDFKNSLEYYMVDRGQYEEILKEIQDSIHNQIDKPTDEEPVPAVDEKTIAPNE